MLVIVGARSVVGLPVTASPGVGVVGGDGLGTVHRVVDGQMQGYHAVAAMSVGQSIGRGGGALGVGHAVDPGEASAGHLRVGTRSAVVDGQVERVGAGTSLGVGVVVGVDTGNGVRGAVPGVAVTGGHGLGVVGAVVNRQVQGDHTVRTVDIVVGPHVVPGLGVGPAVPSVAFAGGGGELVGGGVVHGEVEGVDLGAAVAVGVLVIVGARGVVGLPVAAGPGVGVVGGDGLGTVGRVVDGQVQGDDAVAALSVGQGEGRGGGALGVGDAVDPGEASAGHLRVGSRSGVVDSQVEGVGAGTSLGVGVVVGVGAGCGVRGAVPGVAVAGGDGLGIVGAVVNGQVQGVNLRATVQISVFVCVSA